MNALKDFASKASSAASKVRMEEVPPRSELGSQEERKKENGRVVASELRLLLLC